jgi:hypothetical protein
LWTIPRAVELKSFKSFDDSVVFAYYYKTLLLTGIAELLITYSDISHKIETINELSATVLGMLNSEAGTLIATKSVGLISVHFVTNLTSVSTDLNSTFLLSDICSSFFSDSKQSIFWFGSYDGSILKFSGLEKEFASLVIF